MIDFIINELALVIRFVSLVLVGSVYAAIWQSFGWPKSKKYYNSKPLEKAFCWLWAGIHVIFAALVIIWAWLR